MNAADALIDELRREHPAAARLATLACLPVRVTPAFLRLARLRLLAEAGTGDEADLWLSALVESRSGSGFTLRRDVRHSLRQGLAGEPALLAQLWAQVHAAHAPWLSARARMEEALTWRLLRDPADAAIDALWAEVVSDLDDSPHAEGVARWVTRAMPDLPEGSLLHAHGRLAYHGAHLLLGDASVFGDQPQAFMDSASFAFATRRLPRQAVTVGAIENRVLASASEPIAQGHTLQIPATRPLWLQVERHGARGSPPSRQVLLLDPAQAFAELAVDAPFVSGAGHLRLRSLDGAAWDLLPAASAPAPPAPERPQQVDLSYEVDLYGSRKRVQLPFVLGVMADLGHGTLEDSPGLQERKFFEIDADNFESRLKARRPALWLRVPDPFKPDGMLAVQLEFTRLDDWTPAAVAAQIAAYGQWQRVARDLAPLADRLDAGEVGAESVLKLLANAGLLAQLRELPWDQEPFPPQSAVSQATPWTALIRAHVNVDPAQADETLHAGLQALAIAAESLGPEALAIPDLLRGIENVREKIRQGLNGLLDAVYHHADFQRLEGSWRGLHQLVSRTPTDEMTKIRVMHVTKKELLQSLARSRGPDWDQNPLFKKIHEEEFGQFGGEPYGALLVAHEFDHQPADLAALASLARIGAVSHAPVLAGASPALFQLASWRELASLRDLAKLFVTPEYAAWRQLREQDDARYLCLTLPSVLARAPWTADTSGELPFDETTDGENDDRFTWMGSAWLLASNIAQAFARERWFARIAGVESGGMVSRLETFAFQRGSAPEPSATGIAITDRLEAGLSQLGLTTLVPRRNSDSACFYSVPSLHKPQEHTGREATLAAQVRARLSHVLACSRLMLHLGCMARDNPSWRSPDQAVQQLQAWADQYVAAQDGADNGDGAAGRPFASVRIRAEPLDPASSGQVLLVAVIVPRYQFPGVQAPLRLTHRLQSVPTP